MSRAEITKTTALYPNGVFLQWNIETDAGVPLLIEVLRSGSPEGPWETLDVLRDGYNYLDDLSQPLPQGPKQIEGSNQLSLSKMVYYQVTVTSTVEASVSFSSPPTPVEPHLDTRTRLLKRKIQRDQAVGYRRLNGVPLIILKRRRWGERCTVCYDPITKQGILEHCGACYGTSFLKGYWAPVAVRGRREAAAVQTQMTSHGDSDMKLADFNLLDYPLLDYKDLIIDLVRNDRYEVQRVHHTELKGVPVHQKATASLLSRSSIEYTLAVDPDVAKPIPPL